MLIAIKSIIDLLFSCGAYRDPDYYSHCRYYANYESIFGFDEDFHKEVIKKVIKYYGEKIKALTIDSEMLDDADEGMIYDLKLLGVTSINECNLEFYDNIDYFHLFELNDLFEK
jgi:hypothetical protein